MEATKDVEIAFEPRGAGLELFYRKDPELVVVGAAGSGKTTAILHKLHALLGMQSGIKVLMLRKTFQSLKASALDAYDKKLLHPLDGVEWFGGNNREAPHYRYPNGSRLYVAGLDDPGKVMSTEYDIIYVNEATDLSLQDWELLGTRLRNGKLINSATGRPWHQLIGDCNPGPPSHWLKQRCDEGRCAMLTSRHEDNAMYFDGRKLTDDGAAYMARLDNMTGVRYKRLRLGLWAAAENQVYEEWDESIHLIPRFKIPSSWRKFRVIDFGFSNPFVCLWFAVDDDDRMYLYREIYMSQKLVSAHARDIINLTGAEKIEATIADHDAEDRATLHAEKIKTITAKKSISPGIQEVQDRLAKAGDGKPRLFILRDSLVTPDPRMKELGKPTSIVEEFGSYVWPKDADGKVAKEQPVGIDDHAMDALRYACMYMKARKKRPPLYSVVKESIWK